jgi:hypothetical protein
MWQRLKSKIHKWCIDYLTRQDWDSYQGSASENCPSDHQHHLHDTVDHSHSDGGHHG